MHDINWYMDKAKTCSGVKSDRKLAEMAGLAPNAAFFWKSGRALPSDETMVRICQLAQVDPVIGLLDLNIWRTTGFTQKTYVNMAKKLAQVALLLMVMAMPTLPAHADILSSDKSVSVYYGN